MNEKLIIFVCTGNICRSPMAEYLMRHRTAALQGWRYASAGVMAPPGQAASAQAVEALGELGIDLLPHRSRMLNLDMMAEAELVLVMTRNHAMSIHATYPEWAHKVKLLNAFMDDGNVKDIADPIGQPVEVYRRVRDEIDRAIGHLILDLLDQDETRTDAVRKKADMKMVLGCDHGGLQMKEMINKLLSEQDMQIEDVGTHHHASVDYPDFAHAVARKVAGGEADRGILVCTTGIGMSIAANRTPQVRAALCTSVEMARKSREHNDANILVIAGGLSSEEDVKAMVQVWLKTEFEGGRHERRVKKMECCHAVKTYAPDVQQQDPEVFSALMQEEKRQIQNVELIASENYTSAAVRQAQGSLLTNKYAEGYPGKRWYHGCDHVDTVEQLAIDRAKELFGAEHVNVQPHSGSTANMGVYFAALEPGDTMLAMNLAHGGHLTHGHPMNFSGRFFNVVQYGVDSKTEQIDYDELETLAKEHTPKLICAGASAYSRILDFPRLRAIADSVNAYLMVDMAHIAGLVAGGAHPSPIPFAEFVTTTTHKTLRGPRGGMILCRESFAKDIDKQIFPGVQGGPLMHVIAGKAVCFQEALQPAFKTYAEQIVRNARTMAATLEKEGLRIVSGGSDNHCMLVDLNPLDITGKAAAGLLDQALITVNKNAIPFDDKSPFVTSGIRIGTAAVTTRGMREEEMNKIGRFIAECLKARDDQQAIHAVKQQVIELTDGFPIP